MFAPISFNVIRQALEWHSLPIPELRLLSFRDNEKEGVEAEYRAVWPEHKIPQCYFLPEPGEPMNGVDRFARDLQECFCSDVIVLECRWSDSAQRMSALLYVKVDRTAFALAAILEKA